MYPVLREATGMPLVYYHNHLVPSTGALPTATQTVVKKDRFHSQDQELETWLVKRGLWSPVAAYCALVIVSLEVHSVVVYLTTFCDLIQ